MEQNHFLKNTQIFLLGICIAVATIASSLILSHSFIQIKKFTSEVITVTGSAEKKITSDYIVWRAEFARRDPGMIQAHALLKQDLKKVLDYLIQKGVKESEITVSQVNTSVLHVKNEKGFDTNQIEAYHLSHTIEVKSEQVEALGRIARESTELIDQGISLISNAPEYFYTKLADLKVEMLAKATENAKERAKHMADATGNRIGFMRSAKMGVFQITPANSYEISDWGANDTTSFEKKVTSVVNVSFAIGS